MPGTSRIPSRAALQDAEALESHPMATLLLDGAGHIIAVNQAAEALLVRARAQLRGRHVRDLVRGDRAEAFVRTLSEAGASGRFFAAQIALPEGRLATVDLVLGHAGAGDGARMLALHEAPASAREGPLRPGAAARTAAAAAEMLAHEIKNPLSGIRGAAQLMGKQAGDAATPLVALICEEVDRIAALIDSMEGFTRGQAPELSSINVFASITQARDIARAGFAGDAQIDEEFDPSLPMARANHDALVQVLINLLKNAREASAPGHPCTIRLTTAYRHGFSYDGGDGRGPVALPIEISVLDDGPGVDPRIADSIFDPFVSAKQKGQGLGLALVDKLMRDMGGVIQLDRVDGWTRFRLFLQPVEKC